MGGGRINVGVSFHFGNVFGLFVIMFWFSFPFSIVFSDVGYRGSAELEGVGVAGAHQHVGLGIDVERVDPKTVRNHHTL